MTFKELFNKVKERSKDRFTVSIFLNDFREEIDRINAPSWERVEIKSEDIQRLKSSMEYSFMMTCARLGNIEDDPVYGEASEIAAVFCEILNEQFDVDLVSARILSPSKAMAQLGLVDIVRGKDGRKYVKLSPEGEATAQEMEKQSKRKNN